MNLKTKIIMAIVILLAIALPGYAYWQTKNNNQVEPSLSSRENTINKDDEETPSNTTNIISLMRSSRDIRCSFSSVDEQAISTQGEIYINGTNHNLRGNFTSTDVTNNIETNTHLIRDQNWQYLWMDDHETGYKWSLPELGVNSLFGDPESGDSDPSDKQPVSLPSLDEQTPIDFDCQPWEPNNSLFVPPENMVFINYQDQMETLMQGTQLEASNKGSSDTETNACSSCQNLPAEAKQQCLQALGC